MDVDTPPRPAVSFPPSATAPATANFEFSPPPPSALSEPPHEPTFDADAFSPKEAFGLADEGEGDVSMAAADGDVSAEAGGKEEDLVVTLRDATNEPRRRKATRSSRRRSARDTDDSGASDDDAAEDAGGFLGVLQSTVGRRKGDSRFSFQVHHHHAAAAAGHAVGGMGPVEGQQPERWMRKSTPYVLLGCVMTSLAISPAR